jgi:hypothetical protein
MNLSATRSAFSRVAGVLFGSLVAVGLSLQASLAILVVFGSASVLAMGILSRSSSSSDQRGVELLLVGMTVVVPTVVFFLAVGGGAFSVLGVLAALGIVVAFCVVFATRQRPRSRASFNESEIYWLLVISLISLATKMWTFVLPFVGALVLAMWLHRNWVRGRTEMRPRSFILGGLIVAMGSFASHMLARNPTSEGMIFRSLDQYWRTSLGSSVIKHGLADHPGAVGFPVRYHWLSEAQMGFLGLVSGAQILDIVIRFSALGATFGAACGVFVLARRMGLTRGAGYFAAVLLTTLSTLLYSYGLNILKTTEMGQLWGTASMLAAFFFLLRFLDSRGVFDGAVFLLAVLLLTMINTTLGTVLAGASVLTLLFCAVTTDVRRLRLVVGAGGVVGIMLMLSMTLLSSPSEFNYSPVYGFGALFDYAPVFGYRGTNERVKLVTAIALIATMWFQSGASLGIRHLRQRILGNKDAHRAFELTALVGIGLASVVVIGGYEQYRFLLPILIVGPLATAGVLSSVRSQADAVPRSVLVALVLSSGAIGFFVIRFMSKAFGEAEFMQPRFLFVAVMMLNPIVWWIITRLWLRLRGDSSLGIPQVSVFLVLASVVTLVVHTGRETYAQFQYSRTLAAPSVANAERSTCLEFVKNESASDAIIASTMWRFGADEFAEKWYIATAVSERRSYLDGPLYVQNPRSEWLAARVELTKRFAEAPDADDLAELRSWNVKYFIVDKAWPHTDDWAGFGSVLFGNPSCAVVALNNASS